MPTNKPLLAGRSMSGLLLLAVDIRLTDYQAAGPLQNEEGQFSGSWPCT
jgi:hypothetical protein